MKISLNLYEQKVYCERYSIDKKKLRQITKNFESQFDSYVDSNCEVTQ